MSAKISLISQYYSKVADLCKLGIKAIKRNNQIKVVKAKDSVKLQSEHSEVIMYKTTKAAEKDKDYISFPNRLNRLDK